MPQITIVSDPANIADRDVYCVDYGQNLAAWLLEKYPEGFTVPTDIYIGFIAKSQLIDYRDFKSVNVELAESVFILHKPMGSGGLAFAAALFGVLNVAVAALMPRTKTGGTGRTARKSPNNALVGQSNVARPLDRVPEIFGTVRSWPDLINPTISEYVDHIKRQSEYMCVGRGFFEFQSFKSGETPFEELAGSSFEIYEPGQYPASVLKTRQSNEVSDQELNAEFDTADVLLVGTDSLSYDAVTDIATITAAAGFSSAKFEAGSLVVLADVFVVVGGQAVSLDGDHYVDDNFLGGSALTLRDATSSNANWTKLDGLTLPPELNVDGSDMVPEVFRPDKKRNLGPFTVPGDNNSEIWFDIQCPGGLVAIDDTGDLDGVTVEFDFLFEQITEDGHKTGLSFNYLFDIRDNTVNPRFYTYKITEAEGFVPGTRWQVTGHRISDSDDDPNRLDKTTWSRLAGIEQIAQPDDTGTTRLVVTTQATQRVAAIQERKFNAIVTRKTVWWDGVNLIGEMVTGEGLRSSRRFADALLHYLLDPELGARTLAAVDVNGIYEIQARLDSVFNGHKGEFSHTFDDDNTPALEEMRDIVQAARCFLYREGTVFGVTRDEVQPVARGLFNRRNKAPDSETKTVRFNKPLDHDGIQLEYNDIDSGDVVTITLPDDLPSSDEHYYMSPTISPNKIQTIGVRQWAQAWDRAQYEFRRQIYQRSTVESKVTADGLLLPLNARIQHTDGTRMMANSSDGEIVRVAGHSVKTSQRCEFIGTAVYSVILRDEDGTPSNPIKVIAHPDTEFGFVLQELPPFDILVRGDKEYQRGTLYNFGPDGNEYAEAYIVQRKTPDDNGTVKLDLINYAPEVYAADDVPPPDNNRV